MEKDLVGFEIGAGEAGGGMLRAGLCPHDELAQCPSMSIDGPLRVGASGEMTEKGGGASREACG